ncbi:putative tropinone reductase I [Helianthus annuus]|nr:putative tropinone reductase I [Helianthus annuus]
MCDSFVSPSSSILIIPRKLQFLSPSNRSFKIKPPRYTSVVNQNHSNRWSLQGMTALVTGGTRGIG